MREGFVFKLVSFMFWEKLVKECKKSKNINTLIETLILNIHASTFSQTFLLVRVFLFILKIFSDRENY